MRARAGAQGPVTRTSISHMTYAPAAIPAAPTAIANKRKLFRSAIRLWRPPRPIIAIAACQSRFRHEECGAVPINSCSESHGRHAPSGHAAFASGRERLDRGGNGAAGMTAGAALPKDGHAVLHSPRPASRSADWNGLIAFRGTAAQALGAPAAPPASRQRRSCRLPKGTQSPPALVRA